MCYYLQEILTRIKLSKTFDTRVLLGLGGSHMNAGSHSFLLIPINLDICPYFIVISLILWDPSTLCYIIERVTFIDLLLDVKCNSRIIIESTSLCLYFWLELASNINKGHGNIDEKLSSHHHTKTLRKKTRRWRSQIRNQEMEDI